MNEGLIRNMNERIKPEDTVYHIGDFCNKGWNKHVPGLRTKAHDYEARLNGKWIHIKGNHDRNNGMKGFLEYARINITGRAAFMRHKPVYDPDELPKGTGLVLCGHAHQAWTYMKIPGTDIWNINVGVDVNNLRPVRLDEIVSKLQKHIKETE
jgi:calcineurin-like phosphoesterase family protein